MVNQKVVCGQRSYKQKLILPEKQEIKIEEIKLMISEITPAIFFYSCANKKQSTSMDNKYRDMLSKLLNKFVKMKKTT